MEVALLQGVPPGGKMFPRIGEIPFDTARRRMSVICDTPQGQMLYCKGALESVLPLCSAMLLQGQSQPLDEAMRDACWQCRSRWRNRGCG